jgi:hypothetical protein
MLADRRTERAASKSRTHAEPAISIDWLAKRTATKSALGGAHGTTT